LVDRGESGMSYYKNISPMLKDYDFFIVGSEQQKKIYEELHTIPKLILIENIRANEFLQKNPNKQELLRQRGLDEKKTTLVFIPTWHAPKATLENKMYPQTFMVTQEDAVRSAILALKDDYNVIIRPHPNLLVHTPDLVQRMREHCNVFIDEGFDPYECLFIGDYLIGDYSSLNYDAIYLGKNLIFVNFLRQEKKIECFREIFHIHELFDVLNQSFPQGQECDIKKETYDLLTALSSKISADFLL